MNLVAPKDLASLIPLGSNEVIFQYEIHLDGSFDEPKIFGAAKVDINKLPYQAAKVVYKNNRDEHWTIGFNVFNEGLDTRYQAFFWLGDQTNHGRLKSKDDFERAGNVENLTPGSSEISSVSIPDYPFLTCSVRPLQADFSLSILDGSIEPNPATLTPQIAKTTTFHNEKDIPVEYNPTVAYEYNQEAQTSVTDSHSFKAGLKLKWSGTVGWFVAKSKFSVELNFSYTNSHSTTSTSTDSQMYTISEQLNFTLQPGDTAHVSVIIYASQNASADVALDFQLSGSIDGEELTGTYLRELAEAMSATRIKSVDDKTITYTIIGSIDANVVSDSKITVASEAPVIRNGVLVRL